MKSVLPLLFAMAVGLIVVVMTMKNNPSTNTDNSVATPPASRATLQWPAGLSEDATAKTALGVGQLTAKNYYVVLDASGSMADIACSGGRPKWDVAREAILDFAKKVPEGANLGLISFDASGVRELVPMGSGNFKAFEDAVTMLQPGGGTPLKSAIDLARKKIEEQARVQLGYGSYTIVVVTDGEADSNEDPRSAVNGIVGQTPIILSTIGFCIGEKHSLNQKNIIEYRAADSPESLATGLTDVLGEAESFSDVTFSK